MGEERRGGGPGVTDKPWKRGDDSLELMEQQPWTSGATAEPCSRVGICSVEESLVGSKRISQLLLQIAQKQVVIQILWQSWTHPGGSTIAVGHGTME